MVAFWSLPFGPSRFERRETKNASTDQVSEAPYPTDVARSPSPVRLRSVAPLVVGFDPVYAEPDAPRIHPLAIAQLTPGQSWSTMIEGRLSLLDLGHEATVATDVLLLLGASYQSTGDFERAADYYEAAAAGGDTRIDVARALENTVAFRGALGDRPGASRAAQTFEARFGRTLPREAVRVHLGIGGFYEEVHDWEGALAHYRRGSIGTHHDAAALIRADVRIGRALGETGHEAEARVRLERAVQRWRLLSMAIATTAEAPEERLGAEFDRTLDAAAEASFLLAERGRLRFEGSFASVGAPENRWSSFWHAASWARERVTAVERAERGYREVSVLGATRWEIAALGAIGGMRQRLADELSRIVIANPSHELAIPWEISAGVVLGAHFDGRAVAAYEECARAAVRGRFFGTWSALCVQALAELDPARHALDAELAPVRFLAVDPIARPRIEDGS